MDVPQGISRGVYEAYKASDSPGGSPRERLAGLLCALRLGGEFSGEPRGPLARLDARLLLPLRRGNDLAAIIVLGPKRSGDIYTATEITLLNSVCERASAALLSMRDAASLKDWAFAHYRGQQLDEGTEKN